eukprot:scaffold20.g7653.t1
MAHHSGWAGLPNEILRRIFDYLSEGQRRESLQSSGVAPAAATCTRRLLAALCRPPLLDVCTSWHEVARDMRAIVVISYHQDFWSTDFNGLSHWTCSRPYVASSEVHKRLQDLRNDSSELLEEAAALSPRLRHVCLKGFDGQPEVLMSVLAVLPRGLTSLDLDATCAGPLPSALVHFPRLEVVRITGDGSGVSWDSTGSGALLARLRELRLTPEGSYDYGHYDSDVNFTTTLPAQISSALSGASRLEVLDIEAEWSAEVPALCTALASLSLALPYSSMTENVDEALEWLCGTTAAEPGLKRLTAIGFELTSADDRLDPVDWDDYDATPVTLPKGLANLTALTRLDLGGRALDQSTLPPPHHLRRLQEIGLYTLEEEGAAH